jgi:hypothetical protein
MSQVLLGIMSALLTGCIAALVGALVNFHSRFIRLEERMTNVRKDVASLRRVILRRLPMNIDAVNWTEQEKEQELEKW